VTVFDPPGSISTTATCINQAEVITGYYIDATRLIHGFRRAVTGGITTFDLPNSTDTFSSSINQAGAITGYYTDTSGQHGFLAIP